MSVIVYNNVQLPYSHTTHFAQDVVYDDVGGVDWYCTKYDITVQCVININYLESISAEYAGITGPDNAAAIMKRIRNDLMQPRKRLSFRFNGVDLIPEDTGGEGTIDVRNGPQPQSCTYIQLTNCTFWVVYKIIAHYWENNETDSESLDVTNRSTQPILFNRWTETITIDEAQYSVRIREGKFVIRSDNREGRTVDRYRSQMAVLSVPQGFIRESSNYTHTPDGLGLKYRITDKEVYKMPPLYSYKATGTFTRTGTRMTAAIIDDEVTIELTGCKDRTLSPQNRMIERAVAIAANKLRLFLKANILIFAQVTVGLWSNTVKITARCRHHRDKFRRDALAGFTGEMTNTPFCEDGAPAPTYKDRGTASLLLTVAAYFDPNLAASGLVPAPITTSDNPITNPNQSSTGTNNKVQTAPGLIPGEAGIVSES